MAVHAMNIAHCVFDIHILWCNKCYLLLLLLLQLLLKRLFYFFTQVDFYMFIFYFYSSSFEEAYFSFYSGLTKLGRVSVEGSDETQYLVLQVNWGLGVGLTTPPRKKQTCYENYNNNVNCCCSLMSHWG